MKNVLPFQLDKVIIIFWFTEVYSIFVPLLFAMYFDGKKHEKSGKTVNDKLLKKVTCHRNSATSQKGS